MRVGSAFLQTFASQLVQSLASVTTGILIARGLGPAGQGRYAVLVAAVGLLSTVAAAGQFEGHVLTSGGERSRGRILLVRSLVQILVAALLMVFLRPLWARFLGLPEYGALAALFGLVLLAEVFALLVRGINLGQHHITAYNLTTLLHRFGFLAGVGLLSMAGEVRVQTVLAAWLATVIVSDLVGGGWIWWRSSGVRLSWSSIGDGWGNSLVRGARALLTIILSLVLVRMDVYMLGPMLGVAAVGQVSVATTLAEYLWYVPSILSGVLFAVMASDRGPASIEKLCRAARGTVTILAPATAALALVGAWLVPLIYGEAFTHAGQVFVLLLPGMFALALHLVIDSYFAGGGFPPIMYLSAAGALAMKFGLNLVIVPRLGLAGAAMTTSMVYTTLLTVKIAAFHRQTAVPFGDLLLPTLGDFRQNFATARSWVIGSRRTAGNANR